MLIILFSLFVLLCMSGMWLLAVAWFVRRLALKWSDWTWRRRTGVLAAGLATFLAPYLALQAWDYQSAYALMSERVPKPLKASGIEYALEEHWGIGLPSDAETGFIVYRLSDESTELARSSGAQLEAMMGTIEEKWHPTPVGESGDRDRWHRYDRGGMGSDQPHESTVDEFLGKYGYYIPIEEGADADANHAIQNPGSFYSFGRRGSVTIVDPQRGKVYFLYAG